MPGGQKKKISSQVRPSPAESNYQPRCASVIESPHNPLIKRVAKLRDSGARRKAQRFLIDGPREILLALKHGVRLECIFDDHAESSDAAWMGEVYATPAVAALRQRVTTNTLERISYGQRAHWPVAVAVTPRLELSQLRITDRSLILVLDRTEKPGNLGACLRSASACGIDAVILSQPVCELFNPNTIRASRGTVFTLPIAVATASDSLSYCQRSGLPVFAARVDGRRELWDQDFRSGAALVFGSEATGLGDEWAGEDVRSFKIPMHGAADSLNLSISAAVTLYEAFRQRTQALSHSPDAKFDPHSG